MAAQENTRRRVERISGWINKGATRPFIAEDEQGELWVAKAHRRDRGSKHLFNELVVGRLASLIGLSWPQVAVLVLPKSCFKALAEQGIELESDLAVGLRHIPDLEAMSFPPGGFRIADPDWERRNREHVLRNFPSPAHRAAFYGKSVLDNWVLLRNDTKYDTLQRDVLGNPVFLDATYAFNGDKWALPMEWRPEELLVQSPYLEGLVTDPAHYEPWLQKLRDIDPDDLRARCANMPAEWSLPPSGVGSVADLLAETRDKFVPLFEQFMM